MPAWLVTGSSGFLGRHVLAALKAGEVPGSDVFAMGRRCPAGWAPDRFVRADLDEPEGVARAVAGVRPDVVIHAAGKTPPGESDEFYRGNTLATLHLLDALRATSRRVRVVLAGSAAELGPVPVEALPVGEDHPCRPAGAYGLSKWLASCAGLAARPPLEVVVARVFNPIGPGAPPSQAFGRFASSLADRSVEILTARDLDARRDFVDVRDVACALIVLARKGRPGKVYHVGTGRSRRVGEGLSYLIRRSGRKVRVCDDPTRAHRTSPGDSRADTRRIAGDTGWAPRIAWEQSLDDLWDEASAQAGLRLTG
jgi:GDP-4-dehydro-6-deoxy-D-mannose reductase